MQHTACCLQPKQKVIQELGLMPGDGLSTHSLITMSRAIMKT